MVDEADRLVGVPREPARGAEERLAPQPRVVIVAVTITITVTDVGPHRHHRVAFASRQHAEGERGDRHRGAAARHRGFQHDGGAAGPRNARHGFELRSARVRHLNWTNDVQREVGGRDPVGRRGRRGQATGDRVDEHREHARAHTTIRVAHVLVHRHPRAALAVRVLHLEREIAQHVHLGGIGAYTPARLRLAPRGAPHCHTSENMRSALPRTILYTTSGAIPASISSARRFVSGHVESVCG